MALHLPLILIGIAFFVNPIWGQPTDTIPLYTEKFSREIAVESAAGKLYPSQTAQFYSYIGEYAQALSVPNEVDLAWGFDTLTAADRTYFQQFHVAPAVATLVAAAGRERITIINEAHHKPVHRLFVRKMLRGLYAQGYRHLGIEALLNCADDWPRCDTLLNERGYPYYSPVTGTYVREPQMGALIRDALAIGYHVFPYERTYNPRDSSQAEYIKQVVDAYPDEKILILCGWYHLLEQEYEDWKYMAQYLREATGIDPFTIYQDILVERYVTPESPFFRLGTYDEPTVFVDDNGQLYSGFADNPYFDALVYHPRTRYIDNRPDWLVHHGENRLVRMEDLGEDYPLLLKAHRWEEGRQGVPVDIIELEYPSDQTRLVLPPGRYLLVIKRYNGTEETRELIVK